MTFKGIYQLIYKMLEQHATKLEIVITVNIHFKLVILVHHMKSTRPYDKFHCQQLGLFAIFAQINEVAFHLDLPPRYTTSCANGTCHLLHKYT